MLVKPMPESTGDSDFKISLQLLWGRRERGTRGPKPGLTTDQIVKTAIQLADEEGLEALSMRRVAERLGAGAMSLYRYVPSKAELLDLMLDTIHGDDPAPAQQGDWRQRLEALARHGRDMTKRHPWVLQITLGNRPPLGPNIFATWDTYLQAVKDIGLTPAEMVATAELVANYVQGATRVAVETQRVEQTSGQSDVQWWEERQAFWDEYFDPERFPAITAVYEDGGYAAPIDAFEFGLQRVLDGIAALLASR